MRPLWWPWYLLLSCKGSEGGRNERCSWQRLVPDSFQLAHLSSALCHSQDRSHTALQKHSGWDLQCILWIWFQGAHCPNLPMLLSLLIYCTTLGLPSQRVSEHWPEMVRNCSRVGGQLKQGYKNKTKQKYQKKKITCQCSLFSLWHTSLSHLQDSPKAVYMNDSILFLQRLCCTYNLLLFISQSPPFWTTIY